MMHSKTHGMTIQRGRRSAPKGCNPRGLPLAFIAAAVLHATPAIGQDAAQDPDPLPSLDEMLGLETTDGDAGDAQRDRELERELSAQEAAEALEQALVLMGDAAEQLSGDEAGLTTQRIQEDILRKLDRVIASAQKNQNQSGGSPSSSQSQGQQQQQSQPSPQQSGGQRASRGENTSDQIMPPGSTDASLKPQTLLDSASWGALPDRLRSALEQGVGDTFSSAYRRLTEAYYRRLAEQAEEER